MCSIESGCRTGHPVLIAGADWHYNECGSATEAGPQNCFGAGMVVDGGRLDPCSPLSSGASPYLPHRKTGRFDRVRAKVKSGRLGSAPDFFDRAEKNRKPGSRSALVLWGSSEHKRSGAQANEQR